MANVKQIKVIKGNDTFWLKHCVGHCIEVHSKIQTPNSKLRYNSYKTTDNGTEQIKKILNEFDSQIIGYFIDVDCVSELREEKLKRILNIK